MNIELETLYTPYTLDQYQTFTFDNVYDYICQDLDLDFNDIDWDYDTDGYAKALAINLVKLLNKNILDDVILKYLPEEVIYNIELPRSVVESTSNLPLFKLIVDTFIVAPENSKVLPPLLYKTPSPDTMSVNIPLAA